MQWRLRKACESKVICRHGNWRSRSNGLVVPLTRIHIDILSLIAAHRDPESDVAGSTPLNRDVPRFSSDIDLFHDREQPVALAAEQDCSLLEKHGYQLEWIRREPTIFAVLTRRGNESTKLEWVVDSDFRFSPTMRDETFGFVLHPVDLATNKVGAAYGRREPRDIVDLITSTASFDPRRSAQAPEPGPSQTATSRPRSPGRNLVHYRTLKPGRYSHCWAPCKMPTTSTASFPAR